MTTVDKKEIEKFSKLAEDWWNPNGKFKPLHLFNPARIKFIKEKLIFHFKLNQSIYLPNQSAPVVSNDLLLYHQPGLPFNMDLLIVTFNSDLYIKQLVRRRR